MNLEGKQQIWNDYQKEIADDRYYMREVVFVRPFFQGPNGLIWIY